MVHSNITLNTNIHHWIAFTHISNRKPNRSKMVHRPCLAERCIFVPVDTNLRMAVVVPNYKIPHNHPMPVMVKASYDAKACTIMSGTRYSVASAIVRSAEIWSTSIDIQQLIRSRSLQDLDQTLPTTSQAAHTV